MNTPLTARLAETLPGLPISFSGELPGTIQWMPPGQHTINAMQGDQPVTRTITVDAAAAARLDALLQELRARAAAGIEDKPYFDFNHDDAEASAHPLQFFWGGDDPQTGGILARLEWTEPGRQALLGRAYRRFSPSFHPNAAGEVIGAPINMGGLVNRAAFKNIRPIVAGAAGDGTEEKPMDPMNPAATITALQTEVSHLKARLALTENTDALRAREAEIISLKAELAEAKNQLALRARENARAVVEAAVAAGKLPPQNTALHAKWIDAITLDPSIAETLHALAANRVLAPVISAPAGGAALRPVPGEHAFLAKAHEHAARHRLDLPAAVAAVAAKEPALYDEYRASLQTK